MHVLFWKGAVVLMLIHKLGISSEHERHDQRGFTLIELLVVIIIIGVLAAVAVPIYLNQQKTARDSATVSDVKNLATNAHTLLAKYPDASYMVVTQESVTSAPAAIPIGNTSVVPDREGNGRLKLWMGNSPQDSDSIAITVSKGTNLGITQGATKGVNASTMTPGTFLAVGWNADSKNYDTIAKRIFYSSAGGGFLK
jgi:type IV pilus assembly protein PilA